MDSMPITTEYIKLQDLLKLTALVSTGGEAKLAIEAGEASVNGETCTQRGRKLYPGDEVSLGGETVRVAALTE